MKRAVVAAVFGLVAACSSGGGDQTDAPSTVEATTSTTTPEAGFRQRIAGQLEGDNPAFRDAAVELAQSMCESLDAATATDGDNAAGDSFATDALLSAELSRMALDAASGTGMDPAITGVVLRAGAEFYCPQYSDAVNAYVDGLVG